VHRALSIACELVGATRESVSLVLGRLRAKGSWNGAERQLLFARPAQLAERLDVMTVDNELPFPGSSRARSRTPVTQCSARATRPVGRSDGRVWLYSWEFPRRVRDAPVSAPTLTLDATDPIGQAPHRRMSLRDIAGRFVCRTSVSRDNARLPTRRRSSSWVLEGWASRGHVSRAAGVAESGLPTADRVDVSNLHRQLLHRTADIGRKKIESAHAACRAINPHVRFDTIAERVSSANALSLVGRVRIVVDRK